MSHLHRSLMKTTNARLPHRAKAGQAKDYSPISWEKYFTKFQDIKIQENTFRVYLSGNEGPVLVLLHGGGYSGLTWSLFTQEIIQKIQCRVLAIDIRGHGETRTTDDENLSIDQLSDDIFTILNHIYRENEPIVLIGHSMGGALAVHSAYKLPNCVGLVVIDVVEGTALESLASMQTFLRNRPTSFINIEHAIQWCYRSGQTQNLESARVSMPGQIKNNITGKLAASELSDLLPTLQNYPVESVVLEQINKQTPTGIEVISEEEPENNVMLPPNVSSCYVWRINLSKTEVHWRGWFQNLSECFLSSPVPKLLLLANINGLDTALTVGQMQGKFQMQVLPKCGHAIHEDLPDKVADIIASYLVRQKVTVALSDFCPMIPGC